jgi:hypothetical protein
LEDAFFAERDRQLVEALRKRLSASEAEQLLAAATGVSDQIAVRELAGLSTPNVLAVLGIFPLVEIAWCDGQVSPEERRAVLAAAADMGVPVNSPSHQLLDRWLEQRPAEGALPLWTDYVHALCGTLEPALVDKLRDGVIGRAKKVARAAGGYLGLGNTVSAAEQTCLTRLASAFERTEGESSTS